MAAIEVHVEGLKELQGNLNSAPGVLADTTRGAMQTGLLLLEADMRRGAPRDTGRLQGSINHTITGAGANLTGKVGPSVAYGLFVEKGTRAHYPPVGAIRGWAGRHGMNPFALARGIARRGTRAQPFVMPALERNRARIIALFDRVGATVAIHIAGGG